MTKYLPFAAVLFFAACTNNDTNTPPVTETPTTSTASAAPQIKLNLLGIYPHDTSAYTQGLEIYKGKLYEGTGDYTTSSLRITDIKTGKVEQKHMMGSDAIFGEGITIFKDKLYQLTWESNIVYVYDINDINKPIKTLTWPNQGWGLTHNNTELIISDGTANLYFVSPDDLRIRTTLQVTDNGAPVESINELEMIDGFVFGNVYQSEEIVKIDPVNGHVVGKIYLPGMKEQYFPQQIIPGRTDVLNGIAYDSTSKKIYFTGKRWPKMFEAVIN